MDAEEARTIGLAIWRVRDARGKSLRVVAGLAGMSKDTLQRIETGERSPTLAEIVALAEALQIAPSELTKLPVPAPANGPTDSAIKTVRSAMRAVSHGRPSGQILPVEVLRTRVMAMVDTHSRCDREREVGAALPGLIADLHTSIAAGRGMAELLELAVLLHVGATTGWLRVAGAAIDLREHAVLLGRDAAEELNTPAALGLATWGGLHVMLADGQTDLAQVELDAVSVPTSTPELMQLAGMLALCQSLVAAVDNRPADIDAPLELASELAERTGEGNAYAMGFGPTNVGCWRLHAAVEIGDHDNAITIAEALHPDRHPHRGSQALYWVDYGRALTQVRSRHDDAVLALHRAERISPHQVQRDPIARDTLAVLLRHSRRGSPTDEVLRGMARCAGLLV